MTIKELEKDINFILSRYNQIDPNAHYPIETYSKDYDDIFVFWESKKKYGNINQQVLTIKIDKLQTLEKIEKDYIKITNQLEQKFNHKK